MAEVLCGTSVDIMADAVDSLGDVILESNENEAVDFWNSIEDPSGAVGSSTIVIISEWVEIDDVEVRDSGDDIGVSSSADEGESEAVICSSGGNALVAELLVDVVKLSRSVTIDDKSPENEESVNKFSVVVSTAAENVKQNN